MSGPLDGVRVIDLTTIYSGPICASILGDHGADVIKVEPPEGDTMRGPTKEGLTGSFVMLNRNKRSIVINLAKQSGKETLTRLLEQSDVVVENFRPGVMDRLGFGWDDLQKINARLIYASINGVGPVGPYSNRRVYDAVIQAISGIASLQGDPSAERPQMINTLICDKVTAMSAAQNICSALYARERTGRGQFVQVSMLDASLFFLWPDTMSSFSFIRDDPPPIRFGSHAYFVRQTKDGFIAVMPVKQGEWAGLFKSLEVDNLLENDERFNTTEKRRKNSALFQQEINDAYQRFTTAELVERFDENQVPFAEINARQEVVDDPQVKAMGALVELEHHLGGRMRQPRPTGQFSETETGFFRTSPALGEHTDEVLREFGYSSEEIRALHDEGVLKPSRP